MNDPAQTSTNTGNVLGRVMTGFTAGQVSQNQQDQPEPQATPTVTDVVAPGPAINIDLTDLEKLEVFDQAIELAMEQIQADPVAPDQAIAQNTTPVAIADDQYDPSTATVVDQVWSQAVQASDPLNPPQASQASTKEKLASSSSMDQITPDSGTGIQYVEQEKTPEIPVEVESYLQKVEDTADEQPHEIVIADGTTEVAGTAYPSRPVIVLPITQAMEDEGEKKSPKFSLRWLVEWSQKIIKMFAGKVIYRDI